MKRATTFVHEWYSELTTYERRTLWIALVLTFVTRTIFVASSLIHHPVAIEVDTYRYFAIANEPGFARWFDLNDPAGYPILIKLCLSTLTSYAGILILQALLSTATIGLLFIAGRKFLVPKWNRVALLAASLSALSMFFSSQLMTETSFCFFFTLSAVILFCSAGTKPSGWLLFLAGLSLSFATLIRPSSMVTIMFLSPLLIYYVYDKAMSMRNAAAFISGALLLIGLYALGLKIKYNYFGVSVKGPTTLSIYYGIPIMQSAGYSQHYIDSTIAALPVAEQYLDHTRADHIDGETFAHKHNALFLQLVKSHPLDVVKVHFLGLAQMLAWPPAGLFQLSKHFGALPADQSLKEMEFQNIFGPLVRFHFREVIDILRDRLHSTPAIILFFWLISTLAWMILLPLSLIGLIVMLRSCITGVLPFQYVLLLAIIFSYLLLIPHVAAGARFRMPIEPLLLLCSMAGLQRMLAWKRKTMLHATMQSPLRKKVIGLRA